MIPKDTPRQQQRHPQPRHRLSNIFQRHVGSPLPKDMPRQTPRKLHTPHTEAERLPQHSTRKRCTCHETGMPCIKALTDLSTGALKAQSPHCGCELYTTPTPRPPLIMGTYGNAVCGSVFFGLDLGQLQIWALCSSLFGCSLLRFPRVSFGWLLSQVHCFPSSTQIEPSLPNRISGEQPMSFQLDQRLKSTRFGEINFQQLCFLRLVSYMPLWRVKNRYPKSSPRRAEPLQARPIGPKCLTSHVPRGCGSASVFRLCRGGRTCFFLSPPSFLFLKFWPTLFSLKVCVRMFFCLYVYTCVFVCVSLERLHLWLLVSAANLVGFPMAPRVAMIDWLSTPTGGLLEASCRECSKEFEGREFLSWVLPFA